MAEKNPTLDASPVSFLICFLPPTPAPIMHSFITLQNMGSQMPGFINVGLELDLSVRQAGVLICVLGCDPNQASSPL